MSHKALIAKFYEDVDALGLRFPTAEIMRKTGFSKSVVSEYLSKKKVPSQAFIDKFYESFKVVRQKDESKQGPPVSSDSVLEIAQQNQAILLTLLSAAQELIADRTGEDRMLLAARLNKILAGYLKKGKQGGIFEQIGIVDKLS